MPRVVITSTACPRGVVSHSIEFESEQLLTDWLAYPTLSRNFYERFVADNPSPPTTIMAIAHDNGEMQMRSYHLRWPAVVEAMEAAEEFERSQTRSGAGAHPRRVLQLTTSKERRTGTTRKSYF